ERLRGFVAGLEPHPCVAELARRVLEVLEDRAPEAFAAVGGEHIHAPELARRPVEAADPTAGDRLAVLEGDEERAVGRLEVLGARHPPGTGAAMVARGQLGLLRVGHSLGERRSESLCTDLEAHAARLHWGGNEHT